jgi:hypothetical protein
MSDRGRNIFVIFTPVQCDSCKSVDDNSALREGDDSLQSYLLTLKSSHGVPPRKCRLKEEKKHDVRHMTTTANFLDGSCNTNRNTHGWRAADRHWWPVGVLPASAVEV